MGAFTAAGASAARFNAIFCIGAGARSGRSSTDTNTTDTESTTTAATASWGVHLRIQLLPKGFTTALDFGKTRDSSAFVALGLEGRRSLTEGVGGALRAGYTSSRRDNGGLAGVTAGGGLSFQKANFDFAWIPFGSLGDAFRFSLLVKFR